MNFEELKLIWNRQNEDPLLTINQTALQTSIRRKEALIDCQVAWLELANIFGGFVTAIFLPIDAWLMNANFNSQILTGIMSAICLVFSLHAWHGRSRRLRDKISYEQSLLGIVKHSLIQIDYYIKHVRILLWCLILPFSLSALIRLLFFNDVHIEWLWCGVIAVCIYSIWESLRDIRERLLPEKRNLVYLRDNLLTEK